jgi:hypothetical protein
MKLKEQAASRWQATFQRAVLGTCNFQTTGYIEASDKEDVYPIELSHCERLKWFKPLNDPTDYTLDHFPAPL